MKWYNYTKTLNLSLLVIILITVLLLFVRPNMDLTGSGRIAHIKQKENFPQFSQEINKSPTRQNVAGGLPLIFQRFFHQIRP